MEVADACNADGTFCSLITGTAPAPPARPAACCLLPPASATDSAPGCAHCACRGAAHATAPVCWLASRARARVLLLLAHGRKRRCTAAGLYHRATPLLASALGRECPHRACATSALRNGFEKRLWTANPTPLVHDSTWICWYHQDVRAGFLRGKCAGCGPPHRSGEEAGARGDAHGVHYRDGEHEPPCGCCGDR